jgi:hypothetical protein
MKNHKPASKKLALQTETLRSLAGSQLGAVVGGRIGPLTFNPCNTANCMTLGTMCPTHDCTLTFGPVCF